MSPLNSEQHASAPLEHAADEHWITVARIVDAWGLAGWVKLDLYGDAHRSVLRKAKRWRLRAPPQTRLKHPEIEVSVNAARPHGAGWTAQFDGFVDRDQAIALKGFDIEIRRQDFPRLPRGEYYWVDLIGCSVYNREADRLGRVVGMDDHGAHPILQVQADVQHQSNGVAGAIGGGVADAIAGAVADSQDALEPDPKHSGPDESRPGPLGDYFIPFVEQYIDRVDLSKQRIDVDWLREWS